KDGTLMTDRAHTSDSTGSKRRAFVPYDWCAALHADSTTAAGPARSIGFVLAHHTDYRTGESFVGQDTLASKASMTTRSVRRGKKTLVDQGWLGVSHTRNNRCRYVLLDGNGEAFVGSEIGQGCPVPLLTAIGTAQGTALREET